MRRSNFGRAAFGGVISAANDGSIVACWTSGKAVIPSGSGVGGLVDVNGGTISRSYSLVRVGSDGGRSGGLVAFNLGTIERSFASGAVATTRGSSSFAGGLVGENSGQINNSFALAALHARGEGCCAFGGLVGQSDAGASVNRTYAAGEFEDKGTIALIGGHTGDDQASPGSITSSYWDLDKGVNDPSKGAGNIKNDPGITGLTTQQLQSGLPAGFDPKVWAIDPNKNQGFPYLKDVPTK